MQFANLSLRMPLTYFTMHNENIMRSPMDDKGLRTLLVVDDAPDNLAFMHDILSDMYRVKVANNGEKALRIAGSASPPDLILLDIMMPGLSGCG